MVTERDLELLTAYVDGELTPRQRQAALRLLHRSSEARKILGTLQENAHALKELPRRQLDAQFPSQVLQAIADRGLRPTPTSKPAPRRVPRWARFAVAASILIALVGLSWYVVRSNRPKALDPMVAQLIDGVYSEYGKEIPGFHVAFKELNQETKRNLLAQELQRQPAVHVDVTVKSNVKAVERLADVLQEKSIRLVVDPRTQAKLQKGKGTGQYLVYAENLGPQELEDILRQLAGEDKKAKTPEKSTFESMVVTALSKEDRKNLSSLLRIDSLTLPEANLFDNTIIPGPKDKGKQKDPVLPKQPERFAVVLADTNGTGPVSPEVKMFLASRKSARPGTVQVLLVLHQA